MKSLWKFLKGITLVIFDVLSLWKFLKGITLVIFDVL